MTPLHVALAGLMLSLVVNFGGVAYYVNQDKRTAQQLHDLGMQIEAMKKAPPVPTKTSDEAKYIIATFRSLERVEKLIADLAAEHAAFKKYAEPKLEKLDKLRR